MEFERFRAVLFGGLAKCLRLRLQCQQPEPRKLFCVFCP
jgi:hypothetical protein